MEFGLTDEQIDIREAAREIVAPFDDEYWAQKDADREFPQEFYDHLASHGWLGITTPEKYGGGGMGITEATLLLEAIAAGGGAMNAASAVHLTLFGMHPVIVHGSDALKDENLPRVASGDLHVCFGVTEPDAGLDTTRITTTAARRGSDYVINGRKVWISKALESEKILLLTRTTPRSEVEKPTDGLTLFFTDLDRDRVSIRPIRKIGRNAVSSNELVIDDLVVPEAHRVGEEGKGFYLHPRRPQPRAHAHRVRGSGDRTRRTGEGHGVREGARRLRPPDRHEPGAPVPARGLAREARCSGAVPPSRHLDLRPRPAQRPRGEHREVPLRRGGARSRRPRAAGPRRHGVLGGVPRGSLPQGGPPHAHRPRSARRWC